jgi:beta-N-acetylhexosaminidase
MSITQKLPDPPPDNPSPSVTKRQKHIWLKVSLCGLVILLIIGGFLGQRVLAASASSQNQITSNTALPSGAGPYAELPLSAQQITAIQHLSGYMKYLALASLYVSHMSLNDKIGQLIMLEYNQPYYSSDLDYAVNTLHVGGVIMYALQLTSLNQAKTDIAHMQSRANIPLLISTDQEGGPYVNRLASIYGPSMSPTDMFESGNPQVAALQGLKTSNELKNLGINEDLAPDVDVNQVNGYDMITRTFGNTASQVIQYAGAYLQALQSNGTIACIKHFPGLGGAVTDAHTTLPVVKSDIQQIYSIDLAPFKAFIQSPNAKLNPGMVMPTDVLMPAIDPTNPAELSHTFITGILRDQFHYNGVVMTDALYMDGMDRFSAAVEALQAGDDMILGPNGSAQTAQTIETIKQAVQSGALSMARINESATRIIALKMQYHLMPTYAPIN